MFQIGIICNDDKQVTEMAELISKKLSISPVYDMDCIVEFNSEMLKLVIVAWFRSRGYRFDVCFYDKSIDSDVAEMAILPLCHGCARNIEELKWRL